MLKSLVFGVAVVAGLGAGVAGSQAREFKVWGYTFTTDEGVGAPAALAPARQQGFNALAEPGRHGMRIQRLPDFEQER